VDCRPTKRRHGVLCRSDGTSSGSLQADANDYSARLLSSIVFQKENSPGCPKEAVFCIWVSSVLPPRTSHLSADPRSKPWIVSRAGLNPVLHLHPGYQPPPRASGSGFRVACEQEELHIQCTRTCLTPIWTFTTRSRERCKKLSSFNAKTTSFPNSATRRKPRQETV
jgi:hypothetical protein